MQPDPNIVNVTPNEAVSLAALCFGLVQILKGVLGWEGRKVQGLTLTVAVLFAFGDAINNAATKGVNFSLLWSAFLMAIQLATSALGIHAVGRAADKLTGDDMKATVQAIADGYLKGQYGNMIRRASTAAAVAEQADAPAMRREDVVEEPGKRTDVMGEADRRTQAMLTSKVPPP